MARRISLGTYYHASGGTRTQCLGPTIAGHGQGVDKQVTHAQSTQSIIDYTITHDLTDLVLVGHSFG